MIGIVLAVLLACFIYWVCITVGLPFIVAVIAAVLVLIAGWQSDLGGRFR